MYRKADKKYDYRYNAYRDIDDFLEGYWDAKANHLYVS